MKTRKLLDILGTVILFIGFALAFTPHAAHLALGLTHDEAFHLKLVIAGMSLVVAGLGILVYGNKYLSK